MKRIILLLIIIASSIVLFLYACDQIISKDQQGISRTIQESKKRGVFISTLTFEKTPIIIHDSLQLNPEEAWIEFNWSHGYFGKTQITNWNGYSYSILLRVPKEEWKKFRKEEFSRTDWSIEVANSKYLTTTGNEDNPLLSAWIPVLKRDTLTWLVLNQKYMGDIDATTRNVVRVYLKK